MGIREWFYIVGSILMLISIPVLIREYVRKKISLLAAIGWLMVAIGFALAEGLTVVAPDMTSWGSIGNDMFFIGMFVVGVGWFVDRRKRTG